MKKIFKISFFVFSFLALFYSNAFAFLEFKQEKDISSDTVAVRGINFNPDGTIMYITNRKTDTDGGDEDGEKGEVTQYSLSVPFDISTAIKSFTTQLVGDGGSVPQIRLAHAIEFKPDGTRMFVGERNTGRIREYILTTPFDLTSGVSLGSLSADLRGDDDDMRNIQFHSDGTILYMAGNNATKPL